MGETPSPPFYSFTMVRTVSVERVVEAMIEAGKLRPEEVADFVEEFARLDIVLDEIFDEDEDDEWLE
ncbi:hypothetical protein G20c_73 [Thermus phage G20c]|nr:hypothetical protein G20c_73 [Thermus phage G20c]